MNNRNYINQIINIQIDRPMGSYHPKYHYLYPINYGYVPNTLSEDNEELDCYLLGVFEPVDTFKGKCIAVIHRNDDQDDKLIIVPKGKNYSDEAILALVEFQEHYFKSVLWR